jgi:hypothetical protein
MYNRGQNPNSRANLKQIAGPGRPKLTLVEKLERKALKKYLSEYLESGEAIRDFERACMDDPLAALKFAYEHIYGKAKERVEMDSSITVNRVVFKIEDK